MILVLEMTWTGTTHAPGNSATIQIIARAWPEQAVRVHADPSHLEELRRDPALMALPNLGLVPITVSARHSGRTHIVSARRMATEFRAIRAALAAVPRDEPCLIFLISTTATGSHAAALAARLDGRRRLGIQIGFHGNLNDAFGWRPRNPLRRALDTRAALEARPAVPTRFLVLESAIRAALAERFPAAAARTDVLPLPVNTAEVDAAPAPPFALPLRFGFVGLGTAAKGFDSFLAIAQRIRARWGARAEFVHVGRIPPGPEPEGLAALAHEPAREALPRAEFAARLASLHYVLLPFRRGGYYDLSASGALLDALTWLKPVLATRVPLTAQFFDEYGAIGALAEDEAGLDALVEAVLADMDGTRYAAEVAALAAARGQRMVEVLAARYRGIVTAGFPGLLDTAE